MLIDRRTFIAAAGVASLGVTIGARASHPRIKAIAFDAFPIVDPRPVVVRAEELFPNKGEALVSAWRTRQFEYTWLRTLTGHYADFWQTTQDALVFAAASTGLTLTSETRDKLVHTYLELKAWPDARPALEALRKAGIRMAFLSNFTTPMLDAAVDNGGLHGFFEPHLSTDRVRAFKPDPRAYRMALGAFQATHREIAFCASAGWDAAGASLFGYRTFWVNRSQQPPEELGARPEGSGSNLDHLVRFVLEGSVGRRPG